MNQQEVNDPNELGQLLLEVGTSLLNSGASCSRIRITMRRFASVYGYIPHITIGPKSVSLTLNDEVGKLCFSGIRSTNLPGVNFTTISNISKLSWEAVEQELSATVVKDKLDAIFKLPHYPRLVILLAVSLAGSAFCYSFGGRFIEMSITFGATFLGLFARQEAVKRGFNLYICVFLGSLVASLFAGSFIYSGLPIQVEHAFATSVLFLIPGVPLINAFTDIIDGNILNGMVRGVNALVISMAIAFGLLTAMLVYHIY
ncbi:MAG TPA: threonine/serine exporter family protein [Phnomibacter sp.]|nr:threonine/serine exporter family protein [Phnomibacter sp.]